MRIDSHAAVQDTDQSQSSTTVNGMDSVRVDCTAAGERARAKYYRCLGCRPAWWQFLAGARWFLLFTCLSVFFESMAVNELLGVTISTLERRFALFSSHTDWIAACYDIAGAPAILTVGYFGSTLRRPVWIGAGLVMMGVGFGIYSVPYRYSDSDDFSEARRTEN